MAAPIYLGPERAGVRWLLDPCSPELARLARDAHARTPESPCDPDAVAADLADLRLLLAQRHFGVATGRIAPSAANQAARLVLAARDRVLRSRPARWGDALGDLNDALRLVLRDRHISLQGSRPSAIRVGESACAVDQSAPAVELREHSGVLCVVLRRLWGGAEDDRLLWDWADDSVRQFESDRIIVDLRGNGGGNDGITLKWVSPVLSAGATVPGRSAGWYVGETPLGIWNTVAVIEAGQGASAVPSWHREHVRQPTPADTLSVRDEEEDYVARPGARSWAGKMLVLVDGNTRSSGESSAWVLQHALGGRLIGGRTGGMIEYGNVIPYLLPASGMHVMLPTKHNDFGRPVELTGLPVHADLDPRTPLTAVAAAFDEWYRAATEGRGVSCQEPQACAGPAVCRETSTATTAME